jgi:peptidyl-prolyl cis-trans isomerase SDCCAG10
MPNFDRERPGTSGGVHEELLPHSPLDFQSLLRPHGVREVRQRRKMKVPLRAVRLCILTVLIPGVLIAVPLYLRFHVYGEQFYPVGMSDMRLLDSRVSTTWCQRQLVRANTTFNAFLLPGQPVVDPEPLKVFMTRHLELEDDMKEYWAFYLLQGSSVTVSTCVRWPGASLVVIRGHKHLHQCAYIGDDSSEEIEEMEVNAQETEEWPVTSVHDPSRTKMKTDRRSPSNSNNSNGLNQPSRMRKFRNGVTFHANKSSISSDEKLKYGDETESDEVDRILIGLLRNIAFGKSRHKAKNGGTKAASKTYSGRREVSTESQRIDATTEGTDNSSALTSKEVFEDVLRRLQRLGDRGRIVLNRLNEQMGDIIPQNGSESGYEKFNILRNMVRDMLWDQGESKNMSEGQLDRNRRGVTVAPPRLQESLNMNAEDEDAAIEEGLQPDGIADHHDMVNETTLNDRSKSEFWSSFSSSEERLMNCAGLILSLPLTPHRQCVRHQAHHEHTLAAHDNTITYLVPRNGYYFFVFGSENELQTNYIRVHFELQKRMYNVSNSMVSCTNSTEPCSLPLDFFSNEKVVLELPVRPNESLWNEEFIAVSTCEPRTALYVFCVLAVPVFILIFAFQ